MSPTRECALQSPRGRSTEDGYLHDHPLTSTTIPSVPGRGEQDVGDYPSDTPRSKGPLYRRGTQGDRTSTTTEDDND